VFLSTIIEQFNTPTLFQLTVIFHGIVVVTGDNEWVFFFCQVRHPWNNAEFRVVFSMPENNLPISDGWACIHVHLSRMNDKVMCQGCIIDLFILEIDLYPAYCTTCLLKFMWCLSSSKICFCTCFHRLTSVLSCCVTIFLASC